MQKISIVALAAIAFTGCLSVTTTHEVAPIGIGEAKADGTTKKTHKDLADLCSDKGSSFWRLPIKEQDHVAMQVFSNMKDIDHIQHIGLDSLKGEPLEITLLLYEEYDACYLRFVRNRKGKWVLLTKSVLNVD